MADNWLGEMDLESDEMSAIEGAESEDFPEDIYGDIESFESGYGEEFDEAEASARQRRENARRRRAAVRRAKLRQAAQARARRPQRAPARPAPAAAAVRKTQAEVSNLALKNQVQADAIGGALAQQRASITGTQRAVGASLLVSQALKSFNQHPIAKNEVVKAAAPLLPLLFMQPPRRPTGVAGLAGDPRVFAPVGVAAIALLQRLSQRKPEVDRMEITVTPTTVATGETGLVNFRVVDAEGNTITDEEITKAIKLESTNERVVTVDKDKGEFTAQGQGKALIIAQVTVEGRLVREGKEVTVT